MCCEMKTYVGITLCVHGGLLGVSYASVTTLFVCLFPVSTGNQIEYVA